MNYLVSVPLKLRANGTGSVRMLSALGVDRQKSVLGERGLLTLGKYLRHVFFKLMLHISNPFRPSRQNVAWEISHTILIYAQRNKISFFA